MNDIRDAQIPTLYGGTTISIRDSFNASNDVLVPLLTSYHCHRANYLKNLPAHVRVPLAWGSGSISCGEIAALAGGGGGTGTTVWDGGATTWDSGLTSWD